MAETWKDALIRFRETHERYRVRGIVHYESVYTPEDVRKLLLAQSMETAEMLGWSPFGAHVEDPRPLEFRGEGEDGHPLWERPVNKDKRLQTGT